MKRVVYSSERAHDRCMMDFETGLIDRNFLKSVSNFLVIYYLLKFVFGS